MKNRLKISGEPKRKRYRPVSLNETVGKTIEAIVRGTVDDGEMAIELQFSDGTYHRFVLAEDE